ncbi:MAG: A/G-specific adenine glycosylase [Verrucomicrobiales bacterium]|nr:A/G-specific adenine glycosylase [Verrucomicrobiales bacterium]
MSKKRPNQPEISKLVPALLEWFAANARDLPWRRTNDPYSIWISEIMLQQTQVKTVIPFYDRWMRAFPDVGSVAKAKQEKVLKLWEGLGYYTRARNLQKAAQDVMENHNGEFPHSYDDVLALPGIGRYTAGAICSIALNLPTPILDGNVIRVLTRVFGIHENPKDPQANARLWELAGRLVEVALGIDPVNYQPHFSKHSSGHCSHLNQAMMELGALVCTPTQPQCLICPLQRHCVAFKNALTESLPNLGPRVEATTRRFLAFLVVDKSRVLIRQRPAGVVNAHLWEFPNVEVLEKGEMPGAVAKQLFGTAPKSFELFCTIKHTITRYRITMEVHRASFNGSATELSKSGKWCTLLDLQKLAFPSAHRKVANLVLKSAELVKS